MDLTRALAELREARIVHEHSPKLVTKADLAKREERLNELLDQLPRTD